MSDAPKPYTYAHMYPDNVMRFTEREVNGMRPLRAVPLYDQAAIDGLLGQLAKCGKENCMGHEIEGHALWVRKERLVECQQLCDARQDHLTEGGKIIEELTANLENAQSQLDYAKKAIADIRQATIDGRVCDDVAWFDTITTLHDFCDLTLSHLTIGFREGQS